jgi:putative tricarboxylic transport membrane protein
VWGLLVSFLIGQFLLLLLNLPMAPVFAQLLRLRYGYLYPLIIFTSLVGAYSISNNSFSLWVVLIFGIIGYFMKRLNFPMAPLVLGLVIGPLFEKALVQTSAIGGGDLGVIGSSPTAVGILIAAAILLVGPKILSMILGKRRAGGVMTQSVAEMVDAAKAENAAVEPEEVTADTRRSPRDEDESR